MIRQLQTVFFEKRFTSCEMPGYVDFVKYGEAFGVKGTRVNSPEGLAAAVSEALELDEARIIEVTIDPKDMVKPMVSPGSEINSYVKFTK